MTVARCLLVALLLGLLVTPTARGQTYRVTLNVSPRDGVDMGEAHTLAGRLTRNGVPMARERVIIEAQRFPFEAPFGTVATAVTDVDGRFLLRRRLDRNHDVRVFVPG